MVSTYDLVAAAQRGGQGRVLSATSMACPLQFPGFMNSCLRRLGLFGATVFLAASGVAAQVATETPSYSNVQVVSIDSVRRILVLRTAKGRNESLVFDDLLQSTGGIKAGDRVIVTVRGGPGRRRVSAISLARATAPLAQTNESPKIRLAAVTERSQMRDAFARQVAEVSQEARSVDASWAAFVTSCNVIKPETTSDGRPWFGLWDGRIQADYSTGLCRDVFNQIVASGEGVKKAMASAESAVKGTLEPGEIRDIRRLNNMNWDGWTLPAPPRREP